uniref:GTPase IMAP family member 8 n=1 Tax=Astyanax mexicanus TaxID=7994 RepID=A0A3B1K0Z5_ASTMX
MNVILLPVTELGIILLGEARSGKSSTGNTILGRKEFKETLATRTCRTHSTNMKGRKIWVTDTPEITTEGVKTKIKNCMSSSFDGCCVFLLVINAAVGFRKVDRNNVKWIEENFGEGALLHTIVLFTHADQIEEETMDQYFTVRPELRHLVNSCGNRYHTFNNRDQSPPQVTALIEKIDEMIRANGGWCYTSMTYQEFQRKIR